MKGNHDEYLITINRFINQQNQEIIQPVIEEILGNFSNSKTNFVASNRSWQRLKIAKQKIETQYKSLEELIVNKSVDYDSSYKYWKAISDIQIKINLLLECQENEKGFKQIHFIFAFIHDVQKIKNLIIKHDLDINDKVSETNSSVIHFAAQMNNKQGIELLIKYQVDINIKNKLGMNIFHLLAYCGHVELLTDLLPISDIEINAKGPYDYTPAHLAIRPANQVSNPKIIEALVKDSRIDLTVISNRGHTSLILAVDVGDVANFKILAAHLDLQKSTIDNYLETGMTLLHHAVLGGKEQMVRLLVEDYRADINLPYKDSPRIVLTDALFNGYNPIVKYLLEHGSKSLIDYKFMLSTTNFLDIDDCPSQIAVILSFAADFFDRFDSLAQKGGIFDNKNNVLDIIKNWHTFNPSLKDNFIDNTQAEVSIVELNRLKLAVAEQTSVDITSFFNNRQIELFKASSKNYKAKFFSTNWIQMQSNLFHKAVIEKIMSGDICLYDEKIKSKEIINELKKYMLIFLFHKSEFINERFEYRGETIDYISNDECFYPIDQKNYDAIKQWKNVNFFKQIKVAKKMKIISSQDYLKNKKTELIMLIARNNENKKSLEKIAELTNICKEQDVSGLIALPIEVWHFIASYLDLESYSKLLSPQIATKEKKDVKISTLMEQFTEKNFAANSYFEAENYDKIRTEYNKIIGENNTSSEIDSTH